MRLVDMNAAISDELAHIPGGSRGSDQMRFRSVYSQIRRYDLSQYALPTAQYSLGRAIDILRKASPDFTPQFDALYFVSTADPPTY